MDMSTDSAKRAQKCCCNSSTRAAVWPCSLCIKAIQWNVPDKTSLFNVTAFFLLSPRPREAFIRRRMRETQRVDLQTVKLCLSARPFCSAFVLWIHNKHKESRELFGTIKAGMHMQCSSRKVAKGQNSFRGNIALQKSPRRGCPGALCTRVPRGHQIQCLGKTEGLDPTVVYIYVVWIGRFKRIQKVPGTADHGKKDYLAVTMETDCALSATVWYSQDLLLANAASWSASSCV